MQFALLQEPLDVATVLLFDGRSFHADLLFDIHLLHDDGFSVLRHFFEDLRLPLSKGRAQIVHLEVLHELVANPGHLSLLLNVTITFENVHKALHVHRLLEHVLDAKNERLLLNDCMPPTAEDETLAGDKP